MSAPTYDLNANPPGHQNYLDSVAALVGEMLPLGESCRAVTDAYIEFATHHDGSYGISHEEALLEILVLCVLWRARGIEAVTGAATHDDLITELVRERRNGEKKRRDGSQNPLLDFDQTVANATSVPTLRELEILSTWLYATGEYDDEVKRINMWLNYLAQSPNCQSTLRVMFSFAAKFEARAMFHLGPFTEQVSLFLGQKLTEYRAREDAAQCSRRRVEYHLNMFGAEWLNRCWREEFLSTESQVVVMPGCLRSRGDAECKAIRTETELRCTHCTKGCVVSQATRIATLHGKSAVAVLHGSDFTRFLRAALARGNNVGVVGVACAPGILGAGYRAKDTGLPAQCVLLNASGCNHWRSESAPKGFDLNELGRILRGEARTRLPSVKRALPPRRPLSIRQG